MGMIFPDPRQIGGWFSGAARGLEDYLQGGVDDIFQGGANVETQLGLASNCDNFLSTLRSFIPGPYRFWSAGGTGLDQPSLAEIRGNGESCAGMMNAALYQMGLTPVGGVEDWIAAIDDQGPVDPNQTYPPCTFVIEDPNATDPEGHMAVVSGPNNLLIQSDDYTMTMNEGRTIADMAAGGIYFNHHGFLGQLGQGQGLAGQAGTAARGAGAALAGLAESIATGVGYGMLRWIKYVYAYGVLRNADFMSGFSWEIPRQYYEYLKNADNALWDRFWVVMFPLLTYYLAFGRDPTGMNYLEKALQDLGDLGNIEREGNRQPSQVALNTERVGAVRVGARRTNTVQIFREPRATQRRATQKEARPKAREQEPTERGHRRRPSVRAPEVAARQAEAVEAERVRAIAVAREVAGRKNNRRS